MTRLLIDCQTKVRHAKYHVMCMEKNLSESDHFHADVAAFLAASRAPLQYIHKAAKAAESESRPEFLRWYDSSVSSNTTIQFFRDERNDDIHEIPVSPAMIIRVGIPEGINIVEEFVIAAKNDATGEIESVSTSYESNASQAQNEDADSSLTSWRYEFTKWTGEGDKDVIRLCRLCIDEIESMLGEGEKLGHL